MYSGITTQALITAANAEDLATAALGAGEFGLASAAKVEGTSAYPRYLKLIDILRGSTENIALTATGQPVAGCPGNRRGCGTGGGNTMARLTAHTNTTYQVIADTNGDGDFTDPTDYDSGTLNW